MCVDCESKAMENDKDRLGEKLKFDERANEDSYFAVKEHELIEGMKAEFQKVEAARREGQIVNCPKCPGNLRAISLWILSWIAAKAVKEFGWIKASWRDF